MRVRCTPLAARCTLSIALSARASLRTRRVALRLLRWLLPCYDPTALLPLRLPLRATISTASAAAVELLAAIGAPLTATAGGGGRGRDGDGGPASREEGEGSTPPSPMNALAKRQPSAPPVLRMLKSSDSSSEAYSTASAAATAAAVAAAAVAANEAQARAEAEEGAEEGEREGGAVIEWRAPMVTGLRAPRSCRFMYSVNVVPCKSREDENESENAEVDDEIEALAEACSKALLERRQSSSSSSKQRLSSSSSSSSSSAAAAARSRRLEEVGRLQRELDKLRTFMNKRAALTHRMGGSVSVYLIAYRYIYTYKHTHISSTLSLSPFHLNIHHHPSPFYIFLYFRL